MNVFLSLRFQDFQVDLRIQLTRNPNHYIFVVSVIDVILKFGHFKFFFQTLELNLESGRITVIISDHSKNRQIAFQKPPTPKLIWFQMLGVHSAGESKIVISLIAGNAFTYLNKLANKLLDRGAMLGVRLTLKKISRFDFVAETL